jgi:hypothetical protein
MSTTTVTRNPFWPDVTSEAGPKTHFALTIAQNAIQQHDEALIKLKSQVDALSSSSSSSSGTASAATASAASASALRKTSSQAGVIAFLGNTTSASLAKIITGVTALVNGSFTVTFDPPFPTGPVYVVATVISNEAPGSAIVPSIWVVESDPTFFTVNASLVTATNNVEWIVFGKP